MAISLIYGPSGSGKTDRLLRTYTLAQRYNLDTIIIKPRLDDYCSKIPATIENVYTLGEDAIPQDRHYGFVLVEDTQFLSVPEVHTILDTYAPLSNNVIFYGVLHTYNNETFESVAYLLDNKDDLLDITEELHVRCAVCKEKEATYTQRLINGLPATYTPVVFVKPFVKHIPVCKDCYVSPEEMVGLVGQKEEK